MMATKENFAKMRAINSNKRSYDFMDKMNTSETPKNLSLGLTNTQSFFNARGREAMHSTFHVS